MSCCPVDHSLTVHSAPQGSFCKPLCWLPVSGEGMQSQRIWECFPSSRLLSGNGRVCHGDKHTVDTASWTPWHFSWLNRYHQKEHGFGKHRGNTAAAVDQPFCAEANLAEKWGSMLVWVPMSASTAGAYSPEASSQLLGQHWPYLVLSGHMSSTCNYFTEGRTVRLWCCAWRNRENPSLTLASIVLTGHFLPSGREGFAYVLKSNCPRQSSKPQS